MERQGRALEISNLLSSSLAHISGTVTLEGTASWILRGRLGGLDEPGVAAGAGPRANLGGTRGWAGKVSLTVGPLGHPLVGKEIFAPDPGGGGGLKAHPQEGVAPEKGGPGVGGCEDRGAQLWRTGSQPFQGWGEAITNHMQELLLPAKGSQTPRLGGMPLTGCCHGSFSWRLQ